MLKILIFWFIWEAYLMLPISQYFSITLTHSLIETTSLQILSYWRYKLFLRHPREYLLSKLSSSRVVVNLFREIYINIVKWACISFTTRRYHPKCHKIYFFLYRFWLMEFTSSSKISFRRRRRRLTKHPTVYCVRINIYIITYVRVMYDEEMEFAES